MHYIYVSPECQGNPAYTVYVCWLIALTDLEKGSWFLRVIYKDVATAVHSEYVPVLSLDFSVLHFVLFSPISF